MRWRTLPANGVAAYKSLRHEPIGAGRGAAYIEAMPKQDRGFTNRNHAMPTPQETTNVTKLPHLPQLPHPPVAEAHEHAPMALDTVALDKVRQQSGRGAAGASGEADSAWRRGLIKLLNDSLATELVCVLRYTRHHYTAHRLASPRIAEEFAVHAAEELVHADRLARRIVQLDGKPDFAPETLLERSHARYDDKLLLKDMMQANLTAERVAIEAYSQLVRLVGERDPTTRRLLEDILGEEQKHADELQGWLNE